MLANSDLNHTKPIAKGNGSGIMYVHQQTKEEDKMKTKPGGLTCFCCGAEITAPQFFNGKTYGYTCIKKVSGQKATNNKCEIFAQGEVVSSTPLHIIVSIQGSTYSETRLSEKQPFKFVNPDGVIKLVDKTNNPVWRNTAVTKNYNQDTKLYDVKVTNRQGVVLATKSYK